jgi:hypothetical protein
MFAVCSRFFEEACDPIQNLDVGSSIGIVKAWGVDQRADAAIGCGPVVDADLKCLGRDTISDFDTLVTGDELDELFVE